MVAFIVVGAIAAFVMYCVVRGADIRPRNPYEAAKDLDAQQDAVTKILKERSRH